MTQATSVPSAVELDPALEVGSTSLARRPVTELASPADIARAISERDDAQIMANIAGEIVDEWFYNFKIAGKPVEGVSVTGAEEFARIRAEQGFPIRFPVQEMTVEQVTQDGELGIRVILIARDVRTGQDGIGICFKPYMIPRQVRDEEGRPTGRYEMVADNMPDRKALSIAQRNATLALLPQAQILAVLRNKKRLLAAANEHRRQEALARPRDEAPRLAAPDASQDPYASPASPAREASAPAAPRPHEVMATDAQCEKLRFLIAKPTVPEDVRRKVKRRLHNGLPAKVAEAWITALEVAADPPAAAAGDDDSDELGLGDARKTGHAAVHEGQYEPVPRIAEGQ